MEVVPGTAVIRTRPDTESHVTDAWFCHLPQAARRFVPQTYVMISQNADAKS